MSAKQWAQPGITDLIHRRAWEIMGDGRWYDFERVIAEVGKVIPPGMALRRAEERWRASANTPSRRAGRDGAELAERYESRRPEDLIASGRREWVVTTLQGRATRSKSSAYELDPPNVQKAGRNRHTRAEHAAKGRRIRIVRPVRVILGDQRRAPWITPVLEHLAVQLDQRFGPDALQLVLTAAHEQGLHLRSCPPGCTFSPIEALDE